MKKKNDKPKYQLDVEKAMFYGIITIWLGAEILLLTIIAMALTS